MNKNKVIPLPESFLYINILIWIVANYLLFWIINNILLTVISSILCLITTIVLIKNRRYLKEYDNSLSVFLSITGYWFWLFIIFTIILQLKANINLWFYLIEIIALLLVFLYSKKANNKTPKKKNNAIDFETANKTPKITLKIIACIIGLSFIIHIPLSENQALFILSIFLFCFALISFWLFSSLIIVYLSTQGDDSSGTQGDGSSV